MAQHGTGIPCGADDCGVSATVLIVVSQHTLIEESSSAESFWDTAAASAIIIVIAGTEVWLSVRSLAVALDALFTFVWDKPGVLQGFIPSFW